MSCENLVPRSVFDAEIAKLKAEIAALKNGGLNQRQVKEAGAIAKGIVTPIVQGAVTIYATSKLPKIIDSSLEKGFAREVQRRGLATNADIVEKLRPLEKTVDQIEGKFAKFTNSINQKIGNLTGKVAKYGDDIVKNSKLLSFLKNSIDDIAKKLAPIFVKLAPLLKLLDLLLTGISIFQIIQLVRRMDNAERAIFAAQAAATFATGKALGAIANAAEAQKIANLANTKVNALQAMNRQQYNSLSSQLNGVNRAVGAIVPAINSQHTNTQNVITSQVNRVQEINKNEVINKVFTEHRTTRNLITSVEPSQNIGREITEATTAAVETIRRDVNTLSSQFNWFDRGLNQRLQSQVVSPINNQVTRFNSEFTSFNNGLNRRFDMHVVAPIQNRIGRFNAEFSAFNNGLNDRFSRYIVAPLVDWHKRNTIPLIEDTQKTADRASKRALQAYNASIDTYNKVVERFGKLWDYMKMDRVLNVITTAAAIHNAAMLSRNLAVSLIDTIGETLGILGLRDADGNAYDLNSILGRSAQSFVVGIIGQDAFNNLSLQWRNANRIITAGAGVVMSLQSVQWALAEGLETIGTWIARIGNGLEDDGVVSDRKWPWMRENLQINQFTGLDKITNGLQSAEEVTENIYMTVAAGQEIAESVDQMRQSSAAFKQALNEAQTAEDAANIQRAIESQSPTPTAEDLAEFEAEPEE